MDAYQNGTWFRGEPITYSSGSTVQVRPTFLERAMAMRAPEVEEIVLDCNITLNTASSSTFIGEDAWKIFSRVNCRDRGGDFVDLSGASLYLLDQVERGDVFEQPADVAQSQTGASIRHRQRIVFVSDRAERPRDTAVPLLHFLDGGEISLTMQTPPAATGTISAVAGTITPYVRVRDGRVREVKSRLVMREQAVSNQEYWYPINGSLRTALLSSVLATTGYTSLTGVTTLNSQSLLWVPNMDVYMLRQEYRRRAVRGLAKNTSGAETDKNVITTYTSIPLQVPRFDEKIGSLPIIDSLHLDLRTSAPSGAQLITQQIRDRDPMLAAQWLGFSSRAAYEQALAEGGVVAAAGGSAKLSDWDPLLAKRLPLRLP